MQPWILRGRQSKDDLLEPIHRSHIVQSYAPLQSWWNKFFEEATNAEKDFFEFIRENICKSMHNTFDIVANTQTKLQFQFNEFYLKHKDVRCKMANKSANPEL